MNNTGVIILAAGSSSRFGSSKQLLHFNSKTLIQHVVDESIDAELNPIVVVTGANADEISKAVYQHKIHIVFNKDWQTGMASGIVAGLLKVLSINSKTEKVITAVCDQPFVTSSLFNQLNKKQPESNKNIVACSYADTIGTPVLFTQKYFEALLNLTGEEGAKKILKANTEDIATVDFPQGNIDIDTEEDYRKLTDSQRHILS